MLLAAVLLLWPAKEKMSWMQTDNELSTHNTFVKELAHSIMGSESHAMSCPLIPYPQPSSYVRASLGELVVVVVAESVIVTVIVVLAAVVAAVRLTLQRDPRKNQQVRKIGLT